MAEKLYLYDTTLRDGQQSQGVQFSVSEKKIILKALDDLGMDYIEGGWPGANPTDSDFFAFPPKTKACLTAFGMTKRAGYSAENDEILSAVMNVGTQAVCLVGKTHDFHVQKALNISLDENLGNIRLSIAHIIKAGREAVFDAEHFFDGYKANPHYALACLRAALEAGARWGVLCDTNGGTLPAEIYRIVREVIQSGISGDRLGIHTHNDTENAVANSLAGIDAGVRHIQGTINGLGERCGNANIISLIATLTLKSPYRENFEIGVSRKNLVDLTKISRMLDDILNRVPNKTSAYVGASAFAHKAGLHVSAIQRDPTTYEHIDPKLVGNTRIIPMSNQAGLSNLRYRLRDAGFEIKRDDPALARILEEIKYREDLGYSYDTAQASFELIARRHLEKLPIFFTIERYRVTIEHKKGKMGKNLSLSEAVVVVNLGQERKLSVSESLSAKGDDLGPVNALAMALAKDLGQYQGYIEDLKLVDFKVRITGGGTGAKTRVIIDCENQYGTRWATVGVSANIIDASFQALLDAVHWKLIADGAVPIEAM